MKFSRIQFVTILMLLFFRGPELLAQKARPVIACVGGSLTAGTNMANREKNAYPVQLQAMLGEGYVVRNFGVNESRVLRNENLSNRRIKDIAGAWRTKADIVFIEMEVNDIQWNNPQQLSGIKKDYGSIIDSFRQQKPQARIVLLLPLPGFSTDSSALQEKIIQDRIKPVITELAFDKHCETVDFHALFQNRSDLLPDSIHISSLGATLIARRLYETVKFNGALKPNVFSKLPAQKTIQNFYGYECADFQWQGRNGKVVRPKVVAEGAPWIWRARFWGHEPQTDIALLERGWHLVYYDVAELFGNAEAIKAWNEFYDLMCRVGLSQKVVLEGMSRGGVYIYNWALANPGKVACVYADAPVLDLKSWPGGKGRGPGSLDDWKRFLEAFGLTPQQGDSISNSPLDHAAALARAGFPMLHVVGDADEVVPVEENTRPFEAIIRKHGGNITVIHKPGVKHHPHSLADPTPIVDFILRSTNRKTNFAAIPAPASEYRSGAGWKEGTDWWSNQDDINRLLKESKHLDILFVGNSITQGTVGHRRDLTYAPGKQAFTKAFEKYNWECAGISGDRTQHVLWRLQHGAYAQARPRVLVLTIGVNNFPDDSPEEVAAGIDKIVNWIKANMPETRLLLIGPLPAGVQAGDMLRVKYDRVQELIAHFEKDPQVTYLPLRNVFVNADNRLNLELCSSDGIHLNPAGYAAWAAAMKPVLDQLLRRQ